MESPLTSIANKYRSENKKGKEKMNSAVRLTGTADYKCLEEWPMEIIYETCKFLVTGTIFLQCVYLE